MKSSQLGTFSFSLVLKGLRKSFAKYKVYRIHRYTSVINIDDKYMFDLRLTCADLDHALKVQGHEPLYGFHVSNKYKPEWNCTLEIDNVDF